MFVTEVTPASGSLVQADVHRSTANAARSPDLRQAGVRAAPPPTTIPLLIGPNPEFHHDAELVVKLRFR